MIIFDFVPMWTLILGLAVFFYVLLDGFDLGVGILYNFAKTSVDRSLLMNSIAPIWDGNETWLVLGGVALLAAFPLAFAIIMPAVYFPILVMLLALIFRGVAFEFRFRDVEHRTFWDHAFGYGSAIATFAQGVVLGAFIQGFQVDGRHFSGGSFDCFTPFSLFTGRGADVRLWPVGRRLADPEDRRRACRRERAGRLASAFWEHLPRWALSACGRHSWTHDIARRWFSWPNIAISAPVPVATALCAVLEWRAIANLRSELGPFVYAVLLVHPVLSRHRHQPVPHDRATSFLAVAGGLLAGHPDLPGRGHPVPAAGHPRLYWLVLLGVPGQGARRYRLSLSP